jgi:hypothetical protein
MSLILNYNNEKTIMKIQQYPLMLVLNFVIPMVFWSFQCEIKMKKILIVPGQFKNDKLTM